MSSNAIIKSLQLEWESDRINGIQLQPKETESSQLGYKNALRSSCEQRDFNIHPKEALTVAFQNY